MRGVWRVLKRTGKSFYDDQMTQHAAALTYYGLMSLFPAALLGISLLGLLGQYPATYNAVVDYLEEVVPAATLQAIDSSLRSAIRNQGNAATALLVGVVAAFYGTTGLLEAARRAFNVTYRVESGRTFLHRKARDIASSLILLGVVLIALIMVFVGGRLADHLFGADGAHIWNLGRWPAALVLATLSFTYIYTVTPDLKERRFRAMLPGAVVAVIAWIAVSWGFSQYLANYRSLSAIYGTFTGAIVLVVWVWMSNVAMLFGAELNAALSRETRSRANALSAAPAPR